MSDVHWHCLLRIDEHDTQDSDLFYNDISMFIEFLARFNEISPKWKTTYNTMKANIYRWDFKITADKMDK